MALKDISFLQMVKTIKDANQLLAADFVLLHIFEKTDGCEYLLGRYK